MSRANFCASPRPYRALIELSPIVDFQPLYLRKVLLVVGDQYGLDAFRMRSNHHIHRACGWRIPNHAAIVSWKNL